MEFESIFRSSRQSKVDPNIYVTLTVMHVNDEQGRKTTRFLAGISRRSQDGEWVRLGTTSVEVPFGIPREQLQIPRFVPSGFVRGNTTSTGPNTIKPVYGGSRY